MSSLAAGGDDFKCSLCFSDEREQTNRKAYTLSLFLSVVVHHWLLASGLAIGIVGDAGVRANAQQPRLFVGMILILIFAEAQHGKAWHSHKGHKGTAVNLKPRPETKKH